MERTRKNRVHLGLKFLHPMFLDVQHSLPHSDSFLCFVFIANDCKVPTLTAAVLLRKVTCMILDVNLPWMAQKLAHILYNFTLIH